MQKRSLIAGVLGGLLALRGARKGQALAEKRKASGLDPLGFRGMFREMLRRQYLWTDAEGRRHAGWRVGLLVWLLPGLFSVATLLLLVQSYSATRLTVPTIGEVVQVYDWDGQYSPVYSYTWTDGTRTQATAGMRHPDWNFAPGSLHPIRYHADRKDDVVLEGPHNWHLAQFIGAITLGLGLVSLYAQARVRRWIRSGA